MWWTVKVLEDERWSPQHCVRPHKGNHFVLDWQPRGCPTLRSRGSPALERRFDAAVSRGPMKMPSLAFFKYPNLSSGGRGTQGMIERRAIHTPLWR